MSGGDPVDAHAEATVHQTTAEQLVMNDIIAGLEKLGLVQRLRSAMAGTQVDEPDLFLDTLRDLLPKRAVTGRETMVVAERMALRLRAQLELMGPALDEHDLTRLPWIAAIEETHDLPKSGMTSCLPNGRWVITVNAREAMVRRRFSIAHELCHTIVDEAGAKLLPTNRFADHEERLERFCDRFAGALLMPKLILRADWADGIQIVSRLARRYHVSKAAMTVRLSQLGLLEPIARCDGATRKELA